MKLIAFGNRANSGVNKILWVLAERLVKIRRLNRGPCPRDRLLVVAKLRKLCSNANGLAIVAGPIRFFDLREFGFHDQTLATTVRMASELLKIPQSG